MNLPTNLSILASPAFEVISSHLFTRFLLVSVPLSLVFFVIVFILDTVCVVDLRVTLSPVKLSKRRDSIYNKYAFGF